MEFYLLLLCSSAVVFFTVMPQPFSHLIATIPSVAVFAITIMTMFIVSNNSMVYTAFIFLVVRVARQKQYITRLELANRTIERKSGQINARYESLLSEKAAKDKFPRSNPSTPDSSMSGELISRSLAATGRSPALELKKQRDHTKELEFRLNEMTRKLQTQKSSHSSLQKERDALKSQLADYEFMFGQQRKKDI